MTASLCMNCGAIKQGAWCDCPECHIEPFDYDMAMALSDHALTDIELRQIGQAIKVIAETNLDEEVRISALLYFLSRKWPKLLEFEIASVNNELQRTLEQLYDNRLKHLPGQTSPSLRISPVTASHWAEAMTEEFQAEEDGWRAQVPTILLEGLHIAKDIVSLKIQAGEGALLQRITHRLQYLVSSPAYQEMAALASQHVEDAMDYQRRVNQFGIHVKNGWSRQTQDQMAYFRGFCLRLIEMAEFNKRIIEHKAGIKPVITLELQRLRQSFDMSYKTFIQLFNVVARPEQTA